MNKPCDMCNTDIHLWNSWSLKKVVVSEKRSCRCCSKTEVRELPKGEEE